MKIHSELKKLAERLPDLLVHLQNEEAAKQALVLPFITALGYNVFDPTQVSPEYTADVGGRRGEKVDYAIMRNGSPVILIECKQSEADLAPKHMAQLFRYFVATEARIGILTNGVIYQFFTDLEDPNKMDETPFMVLDLKNLDEETTTELERLTQDEFDLEAMVNAALELRYLRGMQMALERQLTDPDIDVVRWLAQQVYKGRLTASVTDQFTRRTRTAFRQFIKTQVNNTIRRAIDDEHDTPVDDVAPASESPSDDGMADRGIVTTQDELDGYEIVKSLLADTVGADRVVMRDRQQYCSVLLDGNSRKTLCRFRFGPRVKVLFLFDADKSETSHRLDSLDDLRHYADQLRQTALRLDNDG